MENSTNFSWELYDRAPVIGILRGIAMEEVMKIAQVYLEAGFYTLEVTLNTPDAEQIISRLRADFPELNAGAGTVCSMPDLDRALVAGAQFVVTPVINEEVIKSAVRQKIPVFPGGFTPTEIYRAWELGASAVKVFPATQMGVSYIKDLRGPLNQIKLLPTGGVSMSNIKSFFQAGAVGVGMGSSLFPKDLIQGQDLQALSAHLKAIKTEITSYTK
jgi:2-dehydro-3-deoxyphosphogluconate aldolase/(4S)-4-hydroxy-2-oxoglutarate aldolase